METRSPVDTPAYLEAQKKLKGEVTPDILKWNFSKAYEEFRGWIYSINHAQRMRTFARKVLQMRGERFRRVVRWMRAPEEMSVDEICVMLHALSQRVSDAAIKEVGPPGVNVRLVPTKDESKRPLVGHAITIFNSLSMLLDAADLQTTDVFDGDRIQLIGALQRMCTRVGIVAHFSDPSTVRKEPVLRDDMVEHGLRRKRGHR